MSAVEKSLNFNTKPNHMLRRDCKFVFSIIMVSIFLSSSANANCDVPQTPKDLITNTAERIYTSKYWAAFKDFEPKQCWAVALPIESRVEPPTNGDDLCRGFTSLSVNFEPQHFSFPEVAFQSGYIFSDAVSVALLVDGKTSAVKMFVDDQFAWPNGTAEDRFTIKEMFKGNFLIIRGTSSAGHLVEDLFFLDGFQESFEAAMLACSEIVARDQSNMFHENITPKRFAKLM